MNGDYGETTLEQASGGSENSLDGASDAGAHVNGGDGAVPAVNDGWVDRRASEQPITVEEAYDKLVAEAEEKDAGGEPSGAAPVEQKPDGGDQTPSAEPGKETPPEPIEPPAHWAKADREMFQKQSPEAQHWLMTRSRAMEAAHTRRSQELAPFRQTIERWQPFFQQLGAPAPLAIDRLMETAYALHTGTNAQKVGVLKKLVNDYGIQAPGDEGSEPEPDPQIAALAHQVGQMQAGMAYQQQAAEHGMVANASHAIQAFANQKGVDGKLLHPHFGEVYADITRMAQADLQAGVQLDLNSLYERATWANPNVRSQLLQTQSGQEAERRRQEAEKAKRAGGQIAGAGGAPSRTEPPSLRGTLEAAWDNAAA